MFESLETCSREDLLARALLVIEAAAMAEHDGVEGIAMSISDLYRIAHSALSRGQGECQHEDWLDSVLQWESRLMSVRVIDESDVKSVLSRREGGSL